MSSPIGGFSVRVIKPDPNIDYMIRVIDPRTGKEQTELSRSLREKIKPIPPPAPEPAGRTDKK